MLVVVAKTHFGGQGSWSYRAIQNQQWAQGQDLSVLRRLSLLEGKTLQFLPQSMAHFIAFALKQKCPGHASMRVPQNLELWNGSDGWEHTLTADTFLHLESFNLHVFPCSLFSLQPSHHCSAMWHPISWTPRAQWSPNHLKLATVYVLMLLVLLSFASGQSRPFKHQIDNRSKYESHVTWWPHNLSCTKFSSKSHRCFCGETLVWGPVRPFDLVSAYTEPPHSLLKALN